MGVPAHSRRQARCLAPLHALQAPFQVLAAVPTPSRSCKAHRQEQGKRKGNCINIGGRTLELFVQQKHALVHARLRHPEVATVQGSAGIAAGGWEP